MAKPGRSGYTSAMNASGDRQALDPASEAGVEEAVEHFTASLREGRDWFDSLLEAIALWPAPRETHEGRHYEYLVGGEAFDWLLLAERLTQSADGLVPEEGRVSLLFHGIPPRQISQDGFRDMIGPAKYRAVGNYWYGVTVEEALILAVEHEVRKQRRGLRPEEPDLDDAVYQRIYGERRGELLRRFFAERDQPLADRVSLAELKEFTYWLFKYRIKHSDQARLASDTKKGLDFLHGLGRGSPFDG